MPATWQEDLSIRAYEFILNKDKVFAREIREAIARYKNHEGYQVVIGNTYIDLLVGHMVSRVVNIAGLSKEFEDSIVTGVRSKFSTLRIESLRGTTEGDKDGSNSTSNGTDNHGDTTTSEEERKPS